MRTQNKFQEKQIIPAAMKIRIVLGAGIGFFLMLLFLWGIEGDPAWGKYWKIRPLIVTPIAGAMGGFFLYYMERLGREGGWKRILTTLLGLVGFIVALWLGSVLGLDGTLWN